MGYYTDYSLTVTGPGPQAGLAIIEELRSFSEGASDAIRASGGTNISTKWYGHEADMREFSISYPDYLFTLDGLGEDGKHIRKYFQNGKMQDAQPAIVYEPFDAGKLK